MTDRREIEESDALGRRLLLLGKVVLAFAVGAGVYALGQSVGEETTDRDGWSGVGAVVGVLAILFPAAFFEADAPRRWFSGPRPGPSASYLWTSRITGIVLVVGSVLAGGDTRPLCQRGGLHGVDVEPLHASHETYVAVRTCRWIVNAGHLCSRAEQEQLSPPEFAALPVDKADVHHLPERELGVAVAHLEVANALLPRAEIEQQKAELPAVDGRELVVRCAEKVRPVDHRMVDSGAMASRYGSGSSTGDGSAPGDWAA
jgi:hypothetical protein